MAGNPFQLPQYAGDYNSISRQQAIAQALLQSAIAKPDNTPIGAGTFVPKYGIGQGLTQLASALLGKQLSDNANAGLNQLGQRQWDALAPAFGGGAQQAPAQASAPVTSDDIVQAASNGGVDLSPTNANAQKLAAAVAGANAQQAPQQSSPGAGQGLNLNPGGLNPTFAQMQYLQDPGEYTKNFVAPFVTPTEFTKQLLNSGIDPKSAQGVALQQANIAKANYIQPNSFAPGTIQKDPLTNKVMGFTPQIAAGAEPVFDASGNVVGVRGLDGSINYEANKAGAIANAEAQAKARYDVKPSFDANGNPVYATTEQIVNQSSQPAQGAFQGDPKAIQAQINKIPDAQTRAQAQAAFDSQMQSSGGRLAPSLPVGAQQSIESNVKNVADHFNGLQQTTTAAPSQIAALDNITRLAPSAITGAGSDKRAFVNGLLAFAGLKSSGDLKTDTDLLNKNSALLALGARMGGGGTDAAQTLAQAANPNSHMSPAAIKEAAGLLKGGLQMQQTEQQLLLHYKTTNDVNGYMDARQKFEQAADPRIWQLKNMTPQDAAEFIKKIPADQRADLQQRALVLKQLGVF